MPQPWASWKRSSAYSFSYLRPCFRPFPPFPHKTSAGKTETGSGDAALCGDHRGVFRIVRGDRHTVQSRNRHRTVQQRKRSRAYRARKRIHTSLCVGLHFRGFAFQLQRLFLRVRKIGDFIFAQCAFDRPHKDPRRILRFKAFCRHAFSDGTCRTGGIAFIGRRVRSCVLLSPHAKASLVKAKTFLQHSYYIRLHKKTAP